MWLKPDVAGADPFTVRISRGKGIAAAVLLGAVVAGGVWGGQAWREHRREVVAEGALRAAGAVTARVSVPRGLSSCAEAEPARTWLCWHGTLPPTDATRALARGLHDAGATDVSARCVTHRRLGPMCLVTATLSRSEWGHFQASIGPANLAAMAKDPALAPEGSDVQGSAFFAVPGLPGQHTTPVPISF